MADLKKFTVHQKTEGVKTNNVTLCTYSDEAKTVINESFSIPIKQENKDFFNSFEVGCEYAFVKQN